MKTIPKRVSDFWESSIAIYKDLSWETILPVIFSKGSCMFLKNIFTVIHYSFTIKQYISMKYFSLFQTDDELERLKAEYDEVDQKLKEIKLMEFEKEDKLNVSLPE